VNKYVTQTNKRYGVLYTVSTAGIIIRMAVPGIVADVECGKNRSFYKNKLISTKHKNHKYFIMSNSTLKVRPKSYFHSFDQFRC
jgi:hypothetical protein